MVKFCNDVIIAGLLSIVVSVPLYFDVKLYSCFDLSKITLLYILTFGIAVAWCAKRMSDSSGRFEFNALTLPVIGMLVVGVFATTFSIDPIISLLGSYKRYDGLLSLAIYIFLFFIIVHYVKVEMIDLFLKAIIISACISCLYGLCQYYGLTIGFKWSTTFGYGGRIFSTIGHPGFMAAFLIMTLPMVYYFIFKEKYWFLYLGALLLILVTFYLTKTRVAWLGLGVSTIFFFVFGVRGNRIKIITVIAILGIITILCSGTLAKRFNDELNGKLSASTYIKLQTARTSLLAIRDYPILGTGYDTFGIIYPYYLNQYINKTDKNQKVYKEIQDRVHNVFFDITVQTGLIGLAVYLWFIYGYARMIWQGIARNRLLVAALASSVIAYFCSVQACFGHVPTLTIFWVLLALSVIACEKTKYEKQIHPKVCL